MAVYNLGHVLNDQWRSSEALAHFRRAVTLNPRYQPAGTRCSSTCCTTPRRPSRPSATNTWPGDGISPGSRAGGRRQFPARRPDGHPESRRLRIGYVSPDFRSHSCAYFLQPLFAAHDREAFEIHAYASVERPDAITDWFRAHTEHWRDIAGRSDEAIAAQIRADGVDVLVDLAGHTRGQPLGVFALQPAPVQVAWLGYPATAGLPQIGYRLTDAEADPPGAADQLHVEKLVRLTGGLHCYQAPADAPAVNELPALRQHDKHLTFGSFNNISKINPAVVAAWAGILRALPASRLVLKGQLLGHAGARASLAAAFAAHGIGAERIELRPGCRAPGIRSRPTTTSTSPSTPSPTTAPRRLSRPCGWACRWSRCAARGMPRVSARRSSRTWGGANGLQRTWPATSRSRCGLATDLATLAKQRRSLRARCASQRCAMQHGFARKLEATYRELLQSQGFG